MSALPVIINALVPVAFVMLLGILAGRTGLVKAESGGILATLVLEFCLPALLFIATATTPREDLQDWGFFLGITLGLMSIYLIALVISLAIFGKPIAASSLQAFNSSFPNMAFMGIPVLMAVVGLPGLLATVVGNLITSFLLIPLTLILLEAGGRTQQGRKGGAVIWSSILSALKKPLVWAPVAGIVVAVAHIHVPTVVQKSFSLIGDTTSGVALFTVGVILSAQKVRVGNAAILLNVGFKNLVQPAVMWLFAVLLVVTGLHRREMILLGAMPTGLMTSMFAVRYKVYVDESTTTILLSTALSIVTLGAVIALTR